MKGEASRHDREVQLITEALRTPLPPARVTADPAALWACGRHARRTSTEAKISVVLTLAQIGALVGVLGVLVAFVDWSGLWIASTDALRSDPYTAVYAVLALAVVGAVGWKMTSEVFLRKA